jgi:bacillithiol biosynthesis cysteine-adding enzyme BshC
MNHLHLPGADGEIHRLRADLVNDGRPAEAIRVGRDLRRLLAEAKKIVPETEFKDEVLALFEPGDDDTLGTWFNRILLRLFSDDGLVVLEPRLIRDLGAHIVRREIDTFDETSRRLREAGEKISALGARPAFDGKRKVHAFHIGPHRRDRIRFYADFCILGEDRIDRRELDHHLAEEGDRFSPDASLRPIVQGAVLPVVAYVAGPGEIAYHAQLREVHEHFDVPMPVIHPRASVTLLEGAVIRAMDKYGLTPRQLFAGPDERASIVEGTARGRELADSLDAHIAETTRHLEALEQEVASFDPGVGKAVRKIDARITKDLGNLKRRVTNAIDEASGVGRRQVNRVFANTLPRDLPQERVYNILHYLVKYGPDLPRGLLTDLDHDPREHLVYTLGAFETLAAPAEPTEDDGPTEEARSEPTLFGDEPEEEVEEETPETGPKKDGEA